MLKKEGLLCGARVTTRRAQSTDAKTSEPALSEKADSTVGHQITTRGQKRLLDPNVKDQINSNLNSGADNDPVTLKSQPNVKQLPKRNAKLLFKQEQKYLKAALKQAAAPCDDQENINMQSFWPNDPSV